MGTSLSKSSAVGILPLDDQNGFVPWRAMGGCRCLEQGQHDKSEALLKSFSGTEWP